MSVDLGQAMARFPTFAAHSGIIWSDEFDGPAGTTPDAAKFHAVNGVDAGNELACYTSRDTNVALDGAGHLALTARVEDYGGAPYTSGKVQTSGHYAPTFGRIEARIKIPAGRGLWPAFWLLGADYGTSGWAACGEADVFELLGHEPAKVYYGLHGANSGNANYWHLGGDYAAPASLAEDFHVYGINWAQDRVQYTLDGAVLATYTQSQLSVGQTWVFNKPFFLILNLAVGGDWPGVPDETTVFPATMLVDYVRVYA